MMDGRKKTFAIHQKRADEWRAEHPPHEPKTAQEKEYAKGPDGRFRSGDRCGHVKNGMIYEDPPCQGMWITHGTYVGESDIKYARCLLDPDAVKRR